LAPDFKTIADFRKDNGQAFSKRAINVLGAHRMIELLA